MPKGREELILDVNELSNVPSAPEEDDEFEAPRPLPKPLLDFKQYVDSKWCYHSGPIECATMLSVEPKIAYQCFMKILFETRKLRTVTRPHPWKTDKVWGSRGLGRLVEDTEISGEAVGNIWTDYSVAIPSTDKSKQVFALSESTSYSRCTNCRAKCHVSCSTCRGSGETESEHDRSITVRCKTCRGSGRVICGSCSGLGGFSHVPTLTVKWFTRYSMRFYQNSFLHEKRIRKEQRTCIWLAGKIPWSKESSIEQCVQSIPENAPDIPLRENIIRDYYERQLNPTKDANNAMRRLDFVVEQMNFQEVQYTMGDHFVNKRDPTLDSTFRFCQYPGLEEQTLIYENDYPYNCCGCFGEKAACYLPCCTIL